MGETESKSLTIANVWSQAADPLGYGEDFTCANPKKPKYYF